MDTPGKPTDGLIPDALRKQLSGAVFASYIAWYLYSGSSFYNPMNEIMFIVLYSVIHDYIANNVISTKVTELCISLLSWLIAIPYVLSFVFGIYSNTLMYRFVNVISFVIFANAIVKYYIPENNTAHITMKPLKCHIFTQFPIWLISINAKISKSSYDIGYNIIQYVSSCVDCLGTYDIMFDVTSIDWSGKYKQLCQQVATFMNTTKWVQFFRDRVPTTVQANTVGDRVTHVAISHTNISQSETTTPPPTFSTLCDAIIWTPSAKAKAEPLQTESNDIASDSVINNDNAS